MSERTRALLAVMVVLSIATISLATIPSQSSNPAIGVAAAENVTYSGEIQLSGAPVSDGAQFQYSLTDLDAADNFTIEFTGSTNYQRENATGQVGNGGSVNLEIAGNVDPRGPNGATEPEIVFTGVETTSAAASSYTGLSSGSNTESIGGNEPPTNGQVTFTGSTATTASGTSVTNVGDGSTHSYSVGGNLEPTGPSGNNEPEVMFTGVESTTANDQSVTGFSPGNTWTITTNGNAEPSGPSTNNNPEISVTAPGGTDTYNQYSTNSGTTGGIGAVEGEVQSVEMEFDSPPEYITQLDITVAGTSTGECTDSAGSITVYAEEDSVDTTATDGTQIGSKSVDITNYAAGDTLSIDTSDYNTGGSTTSISLAASGYDSGTSLGDSCRLDFNYESANSAYYAISRSSFSTTYDRIIDATVTSPPPRDISISDGNGNSVNLGDFSSGQTKTGELNMALTQSLSTSGFSPSGFRRTLEGLKLVEVPATEVAQVLDTVLLTPLDERFQSVGLGREGTLSEFVLAGFLVHLNAILRRQWSQFVAHRPPPHLLQPQRRQKGQPPSGAISS